MLLLSCVVSYIDRYLDYNLPFGWVYFFIHDYLFRFIPANK